MRNLTDAVSEEENLVDSTCFLIGEFVNQWKNLVKPAILIKNFRGARAVVNTAAMKFDMEESVSSCHPQIFASYKTALVCAVALAEHGKNLGEKNLLYFLNSVDRRVVEVEIGLEDNKSYQAGRRNLG
jgi:hypothetical protein